MINVTEKSVEQQDFTNIYLEIFLWMKIRWWGGVEGMMVAAELEALGETPECEL